MLKRTMAVSLVVVMSSSMSVPGAVQKTTSLAPVTRSTASSLQEQALAEASLVARRTVLTSIALPSLSGLLKSEIREARETPASPATTLGLLAAERGASPFAIYFWGYVGLLSELLMGNYAWAHPQSASAYPFIALGVLHNYLDSLLDPNPSKKSILSRAVPELVFIGYIGAYWLAGLPGLKAQSIIVLLTSMGVHSFYDVLHVPTLIEKSKNVAFEKKVVARAVADEKLRQVLVYGKERREALNRRFVVRLQSDEKSIDHAILLFENRMPLPYLGMYFSNLDSGQKSEVIRKLSNQGLAYYLENKKFLSHAGQPIYQMYRPFLELGMDLPFETIDQQKKSEVIAKADRDLLFAYSLGPIDGGVRGLLDVIIGGRVLPSSQRRQFGIPSAASSFMDGPCFIFVSPDAPADPSGEQSHDAYVVPSDHDKEFLRESLDRALALGMISAAIRERAMSKVMTYHEFLERSGTQPPKAHAGNPSYPTLQAGDVTSIFHRRGPLLNRPGDHPELPLPASLEKTSSIVQINALERLAGEAFNVSAFDQARQFVERAIALSQKMTFTHVEKSLEKFKTRIVKASVGIKDLHNAEEYTPYLEAIGDVYSLHVVKILGVSALPVVVLQRGNEKTHYVVTLVEQPDRSFKVGARAVFDLQPDGRADADFYLAFLRQKSYLRLAIQTLLEQHFITRWQSPIEMSGSAIRMHEQLSNVPSLIVEKPYRQYTVRLKDVQSSA